MKKMPYIFLVLLAMGIGQLSANPAGAQGDLDEKTFDLFMEKLDSEYEEISGKLDFDKIYSDGSHLALTPKNAEETKNAISPKEQAPYAAALRFLCDSLASGKKSPIESSNNRRFNSIMDLNDLTLYVGKDGLKLENLGKSASLTFGIQGNGGAVKDFGILTLSRSGKGKNAVWSATEFNSFMLLVITAGAALDD